MPQFRTTAAGAVPVPWLLTSVNVYRRLLQLPELMQVIQLRLQLLRELFFEA
jgi:hypothetical protein